jgi:hypothetical protein
MHQADDMENQHQDPDEQRALDKDEREGLLGDTDENRNLTGSTTWETLPDQAPATDDQEDLPGGR